MSPEVTWWLHNPAWMGIGTSLSSREVVANQLFQTQLDWDILQGGVGINGGGEKRGKKEKKKGTYTDKWVMGIMTPVRVLVFL